MQTAVIETIELQSIVLSIFLIVSKCLNENNISYFLIGGACLGIARHNGNFVPWDDDIDIAVRQDDLPRIEKCLTKLPDHLAVHRHRRGAGEILKIVDLRTEIIESTAGSVSGVFIDVMPYMHWRYLWCKRLDLAFGRLQMMQHVPGQSKSKTALKTIILSGGMRSIVMWIAKHIFWPLIRKDDLILREKKAGFVTGAIGHHWVGIYRADIILPLRKEMFCGYHVTIPNKLDQFLTNRYGKNYMKLPTEQERWTHFKHASWRNKQ